MLACVIPGASHLEEVKEYMLVSAVTVKVKVSYSRSHSGEHLRQECNHLPPAPMLHLAHAANTTTSSLSPDHVRISFYFCAHCSPQPKCQ